MFKSRFPIGEEVRVDEVVDDRLVGGIDFFELHAHADAAIRPRDAAFRVDVALAAGHAEADLDFHVDVERAGRANRDAAAAQVERERDFVVRTLRSELVTAAYGSQTSFQVLNEYDNQISRAIELLPQAKQLAMQSEKLRSTVSKQKAPDNR